MTHDLWLTNDDLDSGFWVDAVGWFGTYIKGLTIAPVIKQGRGYLIMMLLRTKVNKCKQYIYIHHYLFVFWLDRFQCRRLNHRTITVCHFISDYNAVRRRLPVLWSTAVPRHVFIVALGVHVVVVLTRTPLPNEATKLTDASMKFQLQTANYVHFSIEAASIKFSNRIQTRIFYK
jgi:hypothetical protein